MYFLYTYIYNVLTDNSIHIHTFGRAIACYFVSFVSINVTLFVRLVYDVFILFLLFVFPHKLNGYNHYTLG